MKIFLLIAFGFAAGILGGMGMGGGTLLVPLLSFLDMDQKTVQAVNLLGFLPMCCAALLLHKRKGLLATKNLLFAVAPATLFAVLGALLTQYAESKALKICYGVFLTLTGIWQLTVGIRRVVRRRKGKKTVVFSATPKVRAKGHRSSSVI